MLVNLKNILKQPYADKSAIAAFNIYSYETVKGVLLAASKLHSPVILAFGEKYQTNISFYEISEIVKAASTGLNIPICLHLDHANDHESIYKAIRAGFQSVMYDGSNLDFEENIRNTKAICEIAHVLDVSVEAELGTLATGTLSHEGEADDLEQYTDPEKAFEFVNRTNVDALAISIGTVHGLYKSTPNIRIDVLKAINRITKIPLVLHGGSGTPEEKLIECVQNGISKININTEVSMQAIQGIKDKLENSVPHLSEVYLSVTTSVENSAYKYIKLFQNRRAEL